MSLASTRWLIERKIGAELQGTFLHVFEDGEHAWSWDRNRALRFATREDAEHFGLAEVHENFAPLEVPTYTLAVPDEFEDDEFDEDFAT